MTNKKPIEIDMVAGSELMDTQGEILSVEGADINELVNGRGRINDNHGTGFFNSIGRITYAKKIFTADDCDDDRQRYYWDKIKAPYIYAKGYLYDDEDHPNARAAAAILRNIHKKDCPLKLKVSVEGGIIQRGISNPKFLKRTKVHSVALTFTPANQNTLVEPINLSKSTDNTNDDVLIKSVMHLALKDVPSFRSITRWASAEKINQNCRKIEELAKQLGVDVNFPKFSNRSLAKSAVEIKIAQNVRKINELVKALVAGYGGAAAPTDRSGSAVLQTESMDSGRPRLIDIVCWHCGKNQVYFKNQVKCQHCGRPFAFEDVYKAMLTSKLY